MNRDGLGLILAVAGALLAGAVAFIIGAVLDLPTTVVALLVIVGVVLGGWYGRQLMRITTRRERVK